MIQLEIINDYDGWFENYVKTNILPSITNPEVRLIKVAAYPYRPYACTIGNLKPDGSIYLEFYSALRTGFGSLDPKEVVDYINYLKIN